MPCSPRATAPVLLISVKAGACLRRRSGEGCGRLRLLYVDPHHSIASRTARACSVLWTFVHIERERCGLMARFGANLALTNLLVALRMTACQYLLA
jgi:hypothetical protein